MELAIDAEILIAYGFSTSIVIEQIGSGHINRTYLLSNNKGSKFILQEINTYVFKDPTIIANNIEKVAHYLKGEYPDYLFLSSIPTIEGELMFNYQDSYWRLFPYIENTIALETLFEPHQAYEAAKQFGKLSRLLNEFPIEELQTTIPQFHDLNLRQEQFKNALSHTSELLKNEARLCIDKAEHFKYILDYYNSFLKNKDFKNRVMHHDTKISNVLLEKKTYNGVCVIDLDTLMPGKFISDLGDMIRTYVCAFSENEADLKKINIRIPYFSALIKGYLSEMKDILTSTEKELILFSGKYLIYMQALRFLTDFLNGDIYYPVSYPSQNLDRTKNQFKLLSELYEQEKILQDIIEKNLQ